MRSIDVAALPLSELEAHLDALAIQHLRDGIEASRARLAEQRIWIITPSASPDSGPAQAVAPLVGYARGLELDVRWLSLDAPAEFRTLTDGLFSALQGGPALPLGEVERDLYEHVLASNAENIAEELHSEDVVFLHDPATAGLAPHLRHSGAHVIWRSHACSAETEGAQHAWAFLDRYLEGVDTFVATDASYLPPYAEPEHSWAITPSINPDAPKNAVLDADEALSIVRLASLFDGEPPFEAVPFEREDGRSDAIREAEASPMVAGGPVPEGARMVLQVQRWDPLKGGAELIEAFARHLEQLPGDAHLVLAGAQPRDPGAQGVLDALVERYESQPAAARSRIHIAAIPSDSRDHNATVINALQRVASVVTQFSVTEAFGLTVTEAMWKKRPVVASAVGGLVGQIADGETGCLVPAGDGEDWAQAVHDLLQLGERAQDMGEAAHEAVRSDRLPDRHLLDVADMLSAIL